MWLSLGTTTTGALVHSLVRELRCHGVAKKERKKKNEECAWFMISHSRFKVAID